MFNFFFGNNEDENNNKVYIAVDSVEYHDENNESNNEKLIVAITSRKTIKKSSINEIMTHLGNKPESGHVWQFSYKDPVHSSFIVILSEIEDKHTFNEIGGIEIKLEAFQHNIVTKHKFVLRSANRNSAPASITLSVHVCDNGAKQFEAPEIHKITDDYEIFHNFASLQSNNQDHKFF